MPDLSLSERQALLKIARAAIDNHFTPESGKEEIGNEYPELKYLKGGCFVTLRRHQTLRGCIGTFKRENPLAESVKAMAIAAAFEDPRFEPLRPEELSGLQIELSILGPPVKIRHLEEIQIGRHGILVQYKNKSGTYLPEVAVEQGWNPEQFVRHCAFHKAGIAENDLPLAEIFCYEVVKISEG